MKLNEKFPVAGAKVEALKRRLRELRIDPSQIEEQFIKGGGRGGQKINKTASCVQLKYAPLGLVVRCQESRSRSLNRFLALRRLVEKIAGHPVAFVRPPSPAYARCLRTDAARPIDVQKALEQHGRYCEALRACGCEVVSLRPEPELPDACFIEDTAVIHGRIAVIARPGAETRRPETISIEKVLSQTHEIRRIERGTLEGGDVLIAGNIAYVGLSGRTDETGARELGKLLGLEVRTVRDSKGLHLKSGVTPLGRGRILGLVPLEGLELVRTDERPGANVLVIGRHVIVSAEAPRTAELLRSLGFTVHSIELSEFHAGDGGVTGLSLIWRREFLYSRR